MTALVIRSDAAHLPLPDNSVDLSFDYARLAQWRVNDPGQRAKAMRVEKPPVQIDGQYDMFGDVA